MSTLTPANAGTLIEWLLENGFHRDLRDHLEAGKPWFRKGRIRVMIEDPEGYFAIVVFDGRYPKADASLWEAHYAHAPLDVLAAAIRTAQDTVRAELIPEN